MPRVAVLNVVGLTSTLIGTRTPGIAAFAKAGRVTAVDPALPAVTCTAQSDYVTGCRPSNHGIVANGWYDRSLAEVQFWKQSNHLVTAPKVWDELRLLVPGFTCANLFWWYNMYSSVDYSVTPRPMYPADGRKFFDVYSWPYSIRPELKKALGEFPFPAFWGPAAGVKSPQGGPDAASKWIAASAKWIEEQHQPTLNLVYLPHLDYNLQRLGPRHPEIGADLQRIDAIVSDLLNFFQSRGVRVLLVSEYGISSVDTPVHLNREFRQKGWLTIKDELGLEILDAGNSRAFAVADHQVAHVYINDASITNNVRQLLEETAGVGEVHDRDSQRRLGISHARSGDLVVFSKANAWFTYYYWMDDLRAPDFARCVDIHRKPGYDPVELFLDPKIPAVKLRILAKLARKKLGFRMLMDLIPLDASLVKGSHGRRPEDPTEWPVLIGDYSAADGTLASTQVKGVIRQSVLG